MPEVSQKFMDQVIEMRKAQREFYQFKPLTLSGRITKKQLLNKALNKEFKLDEMLKDYEQGKPI